MAKSAFLHAVSIQQQFLDQLGPDKVRTGEALNERYSHIWRMDESLQAKAVLLPTSTNDVAEILKICHTNNQPVVVHGGLSNLVRSTASTMADVVISMEKMNTIEEVDEQSRTITLQAGVILENAQIAAAHKDLLLPLNFGAKGSAQIGGALSTNAGGLRVIKYGMTRNLVLGIEAVLADGTIISSMKKIVKDNAAYDLKQLFIGSEGTLGVITKATMKLVEAPKSRSSAMVGINTYKNVVALLKYLDGEMAGSLSAYELMWPTMYKQMTEVDSKPPLPDNYNYYVLFESLGSEPERDIEKMQQCLEYALEKELIEDAVLAQDSAELDWLWKIREHVAILNQACTYDQHFDISMPVPLIGQVTDNISAALANIEGVEQIFTFGHVADGNIHFIIGKQNQSAELKHAINEVIYSPLQGIGGSVSAEHGIGLDKKKYLHLCRTPQEIALMKQLKLSLDPKNILNRGKVLDV